MCFAHRSECCLSLFGAPTYMGHHITVPVRRLGNWCGLPLAFPKMLRDIVSQSGTGAQVREIEQGNRRRAWCGQ